MKIIKRDYLSKLINGTNTSDIKEVCGVLGAGKSVLLASLLEYILENKKNNNVIYINLSLNEFSKLTDSSLLKDYALDKYKEGKDNYLLLDEIQLCNDYLPVIKELKDKSKYNIFLSCSEKITLDDSLGPINYINVFPFSFKEYNQFCNFQHLDESFDRYILEGGLSGTYETIDEDLKTNYIGNIYTSILKKVSDTNNMDLLDNINKYLMGDMTVLASLGKDAASLPSYIEQFCNNFLYYKISPYNSQGQDMYFCVDHSFRNYLLDVKNYSFDDLYKNIVCIELLRRGYTVYYGDVDFVVVNNKGIVKFLAQVSNDVMEDKFSKLAENKGKVPKVYIARTNKESYNQDGVQVVDIARWLDIDNDYLI